MWERETVRFVRGLHYSNERPEFEPLMDGHLTGEKNRHWLIIGSDYLPFPHREICRAQHPRATAAEIDGGRSARPEESDHNLGMKYFPDRIFKEDSDPQPNPGPGLETDTAH